MSGDGVVKSDADGGSEFWVPANHFCTEVVLNYRTEL